MKRTILAVGLTMLMCVTMTAAPSQKKKAAPSQPRGQWTEQQAWDWEKKVGIIKGFNQPTGGYPGMTTEQILCKMSSLGFNSVRFWVAGRNVQEQVDYIQKMLDVASKFNMTVTPVVNLKNGRDFFANPDKEQGLKNSRETLVGVLTPFKDDERIVFWDIFNEPSYRDGDKTELTLGQMDFIEQMVYTCREIGLSQPITSSIIWDTGIDEDVTSEVFKRRCEVEAMMDIHNFHDYTMGDNFGEDGKYTLDKILKISKRPLVATECLTRTNGSTLARTFALFEQYHVHFYIWGSFVSDHNWSAKWSRSTYDPYEPSFHDIMWADGDLMDHREADLVRNYTFTDKSRDPGLEYTERWSHDRAWERMVTGPVKGISLEGDKLYLTPKGSNSIRIKFDYAYYKGHSLDFFKMIDELINQANFKNMTLLPVLLDDNYADLPEEDIAKYISDVVGRYYDNPTIQAWELWCHPGEKCMDNKKLSQLMTLVFRNARNKFPNQPLTATPYVRVKDFAPDFDYKNALMHGRTGGWGMLEYSGGSDMELVNKIWSLSDVLSFSTDQPQAEAGWLLSICFRYGRPIFCTELKSTSEEERVKTLERFAMSHVYWYSAESLPASSYKDFKFIPIQTKH